MRIAVVGLGRMGRAVIAEADLMAEDVSSAAEAIHAARDTLCGLLEMPFPPILRQAAIVGRSGLIASLHTLVATCDTFLLRSTRESLLPKIAPLTLDQWAAVNGAQAARGVVADRAGPGDVPVLPAVRG